MKEVIYEIQVPPNPSVDLQDCWAWDGDHGGVYTVASGYRWLLAKNRTLPQPTDWKWVWKTCAPAKVQLFIWLIMRGALPTNALRFRRGLAHHAGCQCCSSNSEDILHVLRDCSHSQEFWYRSGLRPSVDFFNQHNAGTWVKKHAKGNRECLFLAGIWWMWCWRNNEVLGDAS